MRPFPSAFLLLLLVAPLSAEEPAKARALLDKAIQAVGGPIPLTKAITFKMKGTFAGLGQSIPYTGEFASQAPDRAWQKIDATIQGQKVSMIQVIDGKKGWRRINDDVLDLSDAELKEGQEALYADWVATLIPLKDAAFKLSLTGDAKIGELDCVGMKVQREGKRDLVLYFDTAKHLLRKQESRVKDAGGNEVTQETLYEDYQVLSGTPRYTKLRILRNGQSYLDAVLSEQRFPDKLEDAQFKR